MPRSTAVGAGPDDKLQTVIDRPYAGDEEHLLAYEYLQRRHAKGTLPPVLDGTGNPVADYAAILGLRFKAPRRSKR